MPDNAAQVKSSKIVEVDLDDSSIGSHAPEVEHERRVAIFDLLEENTFNLIDGPDGPYKLRIGIAEERLVLQLTAGKAEDPCATLHLSLSPFRRIVKDYFMVCHEYFEAIKSAPPSRIEALDMGRRALHDEGSALLAARLEGKVNLDMLTARRLFTLLCALHWKG